MLYKVVLPFESMDEILRCDHSNKSYWAVVSRGTSVYYVVQGGFGLCNLWMKSYVMTIQMKAIDQYFPVVLFTMSI